jgi:hypothetical protein
MKWSEHGLCWGDGEHAWVKQPFRILYCKEDGSFVENLESLGQIVS